MATALTDDQMKLVTAAAQPLAVEKRDVFLWRVLGYLELDAARPPSDEDVGTAVQPVAQGLGRWGFCAGSGRRKGWGQFATSEEFLCHV